MDYELIGLGLVGYLGLGAVLLVRSWLTPRRQPFPAGSHLEPLIVVLWPALPKLWWPRRRRTRRPSRPPVADRSTRDIGPGQPDTPPP